MPRSIAASATNCRARSRSTMPSCSPTRTNTRWRGSIPTARFEKQLRDQFDGDFKISFNLAPPMLGGGTDALGRPRKRAFGAWMMPLFRVLAGLRGLRGTAFDIFGYSADRKLERDLIAGYEKDVATCLAALSPVTLDTAIEIAVAAGSHPGLRPGEGKGGRRMPRRATRNWPPTSPTRRRRRARSRRSKIRPHRPCNVLASAARNSATNSNSWKSKFPRDSRLLN